MRLVAQDLLNTCVGHPCGLTDAPVALTFGDGCTDSGTPLGFGGVPLHGRPSDTDQRVHLLAEAEQGCLVCLVAGVAKVHPLTDDGFALGLDLGGVAAEDGACVADGFSAGEVSGHMASILATREVVKWQM